MTVTPLNPYDIQPPAPGTSIFGDYLDAYFHALPAGDKQKIWIQFLNDNNLTEPVPVTIANEKLFLNYLQFVFETQTFLVTDIAGKVRNSGTGVSPEEIKKRNIMFNVLNSVLDMLLSLQNTVGVEAKNLAFYGRWQQEYTRQLARVPTYVGGESSAVSFPTDGLGNADLSDLGKFIFGYDNISFEDIANWLADTTLKGTGGTFAISSARTETDPNGQVFPNARITFTAGNPGLFNPYYTVERSYYAPDGPGGASQFHHDTIGGPGGPFVVTPSGANTSTKFDEWVGVAEDVFRNLWNNATVQSYIGGFINDANLTFLNSTQDPKLSDDEIRNQIFRPTNTVTDPYSTISILKPFTFVTPSNNTDAGDEDHNLGDSNAKSRAEINARDQQYIENIRSNRQIVQDASEQIQSNLDQSRQTLSQQADLFTSIIDSLKGLIASIFR